jgi:ribosomal protein S18 acetylase RimI-like enzyme
MAPLKSSTATQVKLRLMIPSDIPAGMRLKELAGWNQTPEDWLRFLRADPEGSFVAESGRRVVGTATTITYENLIAWVGMVLVDPEFRRQRIGTALLTEALDHLDARRVRCTKLDATPEGRRVYEKLGFQTEYEIERWMLSRLGTIPKPSLVPASLDEIFGLDRNVFGADRSALLTSFAQQAPEFVLAQRENDVLKGYSFGRKGSEADQLGPWVARDRTSASKLLDEFLRRSGRGVVFVDFLKANHWGESLLAERGFRFSRALVRMCRGENRNPGRPELVCAIAGPEFG